MPLAVSMIEDYFAPLPPSCTKTLDGAAIQSPLSGSAQLGRSHNTQANGNKEVSLSAPSQAAEEYSVKLQGVAGDKHTYTAVCVSTER